MKFQLKPMERVLVMAHEIMLAHEEGIAGLTSHDLAQRVGVSPRTVRNNMKRWGSYAGVEYVTVKHREGVKKYVYRMKASPDSWWGQRSRSQMRRVNVLRDMGHTVK